MVSDNERQKAVARAYQAALAVLRKRHDHEFHEILSSVYEEMGLSVKKRASRVEAQQKRVAAARTVVEGHLQKAVEAAAVLQNVDHSS